MGAFNDIILPGLPEHGGVVAATSERLVEKKRPKKKKSGKTTRKVKVKTGKASWAAAHSRGGRIDVGHPADLINVKIER